MDTVLELSKQLWPILVIMAGLIFALIIGRDKKEKKKK